MASMGKTSSPRLETSETPASAPVQSKRSVKLLLIILLFAVIIFIIVAAVLVVLVATKKKGTEPTAAQAPPAVSVPLPFASSVDLSKPPIFVQLDPFTVNLRSGQGADTHYLQTNIALRVSDQKTAEALKGWMPEIRNRINMILTSKSVDEVQSNANHEKIQNEILKGLNAMFGVPPTPPEVPHVQGPLGPIKGVLFVSFIVQ